MPSMILLALASGEKNVTHSNNNDLLIPTKDALDRDLYYYSTTFYSAAALVTSYISSTSGLPSLCVLSLKRFYMVHLPNPIRGPLEYSKELFPGVYVSLFILCLHVLLKNKRIPKVLLSCVIVMFALASVDVALEILNLFLFVIKTNNIPDANLHYKFLVYITSK